MRLHAPVGTIPTTNRKVTGYQKNQSLQQEDCMRHLDYMNENGYKHKHNKYLHQKQKAENTLPKN